MLKPENIIVEGECFWESEFSEDKYNQIRQIIIEYLRTENYTPKDLRSAIFNRFLSMSFLLNPPQYNLSNKIKIKNAIGLISKTDYEQEVFFNSLRYTRDDIPYEIHTNINYRQIKDKRGFYINIRTEPTLLFKIRLLSYSLSYNEFTINDIINTNKN